MERLPLRLVCEPRETCGFLILCLGVQLEGIEKQRKRATDARDLFTYYLDFVYDNTSDRLDALLLGSGEEGKSKCAIMTRRLLSLAKDLDAEGRVREGIEKYGERLEKDLLKGFDRAYRRANLSEMRVNRLRLFLRLIRRNMQRCYTTLTVALRWCKSS